MLPLQHHVGKEKKKLFYFLLYQFLATPLANKLGNPKTHKTQNIFFKITGFSLKREKKAKCESTVNIHFILVVGQTDVP